MRRGNNSSGNYRNPCLTMHQPWASLLVYGIKRVEGRSWPAPITGRLWIHAASKVPDEATIKAMEYFYKEIYALNGITDIKFPEHYPVSRLLGCVEVVGCLKREELAGWDLVPEGVRLEAQTDYCWLCEQPQKLLIPFEMRGYQGVYNLERKIYEAAVRAELDRSSSISAAIAGARAAATQFSKKDQNSHSTAQNNIPDKMNSSHDEKEIARSYSLRSRSRSKEKDSVSSSELSKKFNDGVLPSNQEEKSSFNNIEGSTSRNRSPRGERRQHPQQASQRRNEEYDQGTPEYKERSIRDRYEASRKHNRTPGAEADPRQFTRPPSKIFAAALKSLKQ